MDPVPSAPVSVKALRFASTASAALRDLDRHLRSGWWLDMRSICFSILKRIDLQSVSADVMTLWNLFERRRKLHFDHLGVEVRLSSFTLELSRLVKFSFQYEQNGRFR